MTKQSRDARKAGLCTLALLAPALLSMHAAAQGTAATYPSKPIRMILALQPRRSGRRDCTTQSRKGSPSCPSRKLVDVEIVDFSQR